MSKQQKVISYANVSKTGLVMSPDGSGYAVDWTVLPVSDHFFLATSCHIKKDLTGIHILFGTASSFEESEHYDLAVELHFPIHEAKLFLYNSVFVELGGNGKIPFYESVKEALNKLNVGSLLETENKMRKLPTNKNASFRMFPANFAAMSYSGTQALVEFFEVTPELVHFVTTRTQTRPHSGVKPVISIILDTVVLFQFMSQCRDLLKNVSTQEVSI